MAINDRYKVIESLGKGTYGYVLKAKCRTTKKPVALKFMINVAKTE